VCAECGHLLDGAYTKARRYIYQNPQDAKFPAIIENTDVTEKALSFLIHQGRIVIGGRSGGGTKCKVCGKETAEGSVCSQCKGKLAAEKIFSGTNRPEDNKKSEKYAVLPLTRK
jgi:predicted amidophosphoribosyltransferase